MIEITHPQAQRMIRENLDGRLAHEQWTTLQVHLEGCAHCRDYQAGLARTERSLVRTLRHRWSGARGPDDGTADRVLKTRDRRKELRRAGGYAGLGFLGLLLIMLYAGYRRATAPPVTATPLPVSAGLHQTPSPTPQRNTFQGVSLFVSDRDGNREIYLLSPSGSAAAPELTNLTNHPANDSDPAWSPDGEWVAFLSDRDGTAKGAKTEVYVMHVAGSRLTQLTDEPGVVWQGPLSWSADGQWIALTGARPAQNGAEGRSWVYLVPVGGGAESASPRSVGPRSVGPRNGGARSLGLTGDASGTVKFSPTQLLLAYDTGAPGSDLMVYNLSTGWYSSITWADNNLNGMRTAKGGMFDWSPSGRRLAYIAEGQGNPSISQVRATLGLDQYVTQLYNSESNQVLVQNPQPGAYRGAVWVPGNGEERVSFLQDEGSNGCWTVHLQRAYANDASTRNLPGLCVDGSLSAGSWTPDGLWLLAPGHLPGQAEQAIYALKMPQDLVSSEPDTVERVADLPVQPASISLVQPQLRPKGESLSIAPQAVSQVSTAETPAAPDAAATADATAVAVATATPDPTPPGSDTPGRLLYSVLDGAAPGILRRINPDGSDPVLLVQAGGEAQGGASLRENSCPAWSPSGEQAAFLSDRGSRYARVNEVFVMDADGQNVRPLTKPVFPYAESQLGAAGDPSPRYDCPVWSPDGQKLAAVIHTSRGSYLALIPVDGSAGVLYQPVSETSYMTGPAWSADGKSILLVYRRNGTASPRIVLIDVSGGQTDSSQVRTLVDSDGWAEIFGLAFSPDGKQVAYIAGYSHANQPTTFQMRLIALDGSYQHALADLPESRLNAWLGRDTLAWLPDGRITFLIRQRMDERLKTFLYAVTMDQDLVTIRQLVAFEDVVYDTAWSPDGRWLGYTSESGLWVLDLSAAQRGKVGPYQLSAERVYEISWR